MRDIDEGVGKVSEQERNIWGRQMWGERMCDFLCSSSSLPVCGYEWSVWGQMSVSSGGPFAEERWVELQHLPLTSEDPPPPFLSLFLSDRWRSRDSDEMPLLTPQPPPRPGNEFLHYHLVVFSSSSSSCAPHSRPLLSIPVSTASLPPPPPPRLLTHPLSYDNLFWLLTSCLSLIQYSGFSAIQPWPITIWHFMNKLVLIPSCLKTNITRLQFQMLQAFEMKKKKSQEKNIFLTPYIF